MKAMILSAGLGTRLKFLTDFKPKALVEINGFTLLELVIKRLASCGIKEIIINTHHHEEQIIGFLNKKEFFKPYISRFEVSSEKDFLLDTGGGIKKVSWFFDDNKPFLVHNVDVLSTLDINKMYEHHIQTKSLVTLAVRERKTDRYFLFDAEGTLCGWENTKINERKIISKSSSYSDSPIRPIFVSETGNRKNRESERMGYKLHPLAFSGIHIISPEIFGLITEQRKFSITDVYLRLAKDYKITAFIHNETKWLDVGNKKNLENAVSLLGENFFTV